MADKPLSRVYFLFARNTKKDAERQQDDPSGYCSCRLSTARFLEIEDKVASDVIISTRQSGQRSLSLADNTKLTGNEGSDNIISVVETEIVLPLAAKGSRTVILQTGNKINDSKRKVGAANALHTISFRFPSWATILTITDALGEIIPPEKIAASPTQNQIYPTFKVKGGRRYPIAKQSAAKTEPTAKVATTNADLQAIAAQSGDRAIEGAG